MRIHVLETTPKQRLKKVLILIGIACLLGGGYAILSIRGRMLPCVFYEITHLRCPGCGVTHMMTSLIQFRFSEAFHSNQALFILLPVFVFFFIKITTRYIRTGSLKFTKFEKYLCFVIILLLLTFAVLRNIFGF